MGERISDLKATQLPAPQRCFVKESVFPFSQFPGSDPALTPRMRSTGQVLGHDESFGKAYLKCQIAVNPRIHGKGKVFISARDAEKTAALQVAKKLLDLECSIVSTQGTAQFLSGRGIQVEWIHKVSEWRPNIVDLIKNGEIALVINIPGGFRSKQDEELIRRAALEHGVPLVTTMSGALMVVRGMEETRRSPFALSALEP